MNRQRIAARRLSMSRLGAGSLLAMLVGLAMVFLTIALVMGLWQAYLLRMIYEIQTLTKSFA